MIFTIRSSDSSKLSFVPKPIRKAVLPAAGFGTRLLPATKSLPKELLPIVDTPVLQFLVEEAVAAGVTEIIFVINTGKEAIWEHFAPNRVLEHFLAERGKTDELARLRKIHHLANFSYVLQSEQLGDGHAILQARELVGDEPFLVLFGDDIVHADVPVARQLVDVFNQTSSAVVALQNVPRERVGSYGVVAPKSINGSRVEIGGFVEKPQPDVAPSTLAIVGKYVCPPEIFPILAAHPNASGEIRLIDALAKLLQSTPVHGHLFDGVRYDTGDKAGYVAAVIDYALRHPEISAATTKHIREIAARLPPA